MWARSAKVLLAVAFLLGAGGSLAAQEGFKTLRFEEDWSFLDDPEALTTHWFPVIKHVELDDDWSASYGGQWRLRWVRETNKAFGGAHPQVNTFVLHRVRLHADFRNRDGWRIFTELRDARINGNERPALAIDQTNVDLLNAFVELTQGGTTVRAGRTELLYGSQRFVSPLEWGNTRRTFDGVLVRQQVDGGRVDAFVTHPVTIKGRDRDTSDSSRTFGGVYTQWELDEGEGLDAYVLVLDENDRLATGSMRTGKLDVYTLGVRHHSKAGAWDWEGEVAQQFGQLAGDRIEATSVSASLGHTFAECSGSPRLGLAVDVATGDDDPTDDEVHTFNQLFPLGHAYFGYIDLVGRQNIIDVHPNLSVQLGERTTAAAAYHFFRLYEEKDALYNAGGAATLADPTGNAGRSVGQELDLTVVHRPESLAPHGHVLLGFSHFTPGRFVSSLSSGERTKLVYAQFTMTF